MVLAFRLVLLSDEFGCCNFVGHVSVSSSFVSGPIGVSDNKALCRVLGVLPMGAGWLEQSSRCLTDTAVARSSSPLSPPVLPGRRWGSSGVGASCRVAVAQRTGQRVRTVETATIQVNRRPHETDRTTGRGQKVDGTFRPSLAWLKI